MKPLDFLVIGAQKCATTTLFEHLRSHPKIAMPIEKEVPFFSSDECSAQSWRQYADLHFANARPDQLWGKATPQYMCDPLAAARIHRSMPQVKLIAILRDPISRSLSHHKMGQRRETEARSYDETFSALLEAEPIHGDAAQLPPHHEQGYQSESDFYISWSEYGRILSDFLEHFPATQLLVLYTEELQEKPQETLDRLLEFIGLEPGFNPPTLGKVIHRGGSRKRIPQSVRERLRNIKALHRLWQLLPETHRGRLRFRYEQWNISKRENPEELSDELREALQEHYSRDLRKLLQLPVSPPPWAERYGLH